MVRDPRLPLLRWAIVRVAAALSAIATAAAGPAGEVVLPAARDANAPAGLPVRMLFDFPVRDPNVSTGPDGTFYLVATTAAATKRISMWYENDGVRMWRSADLVHWAAVTGRGEPDGFVWSLDRDGTWAKAFRKSPWVSPHGELRRAVWAPEIHYLHGTFWIPYCMNYSGTGLLKSTTGRPEGPYVDAHPSGPLTPGNDASMFGDDDGSVYFLHGGYSIARMTPDLTALAEKPRDLTPKRKGWGEGVYMVKVRGRYLLINSGNPHADDNALPGSYDCYAAASEPGAGIYGPYGERYRAIPYDGHNNLFQDRGGQWWSTYFGSTGGPWLTRPGVLPVTIDDDLRVSPAVAGRGRCGRWRRPPRRPTG